MVDEQRIQTIQSLLKSIEEIERVINDLTFEKNNLHDKINNIKISSDPISFKITINAADTVEIKQYLCFWSKNGVLLRSMPADELLKFIVSDGFIDCLKAIYKRLEDEKRKLEDEIQKLQQIVSIFQF